MKHRIILAALGLAALTLAALPASAQSMRTNIPFAFTAGKTTLPPGEYRVSVDPGFHMVRLQPVSGSTATYSVLLSPATEQRRGKDVDTGMLEFRKLGDQYYLGAVFSPDHVLGNMVPLPKRVSEQARTITAPAE